MGTNRGLAITAQLLGALGKGFTAYQQERARREALARDDEDRALRRQAAQQNMMFQGWQIKKAMDEEARMNQPSPFFPGRGAIPGTEGRWDLSYSNIPTEPIDMERTEYRWEAPVVSNEGPPGKVWPGQKAPIRATDLSLRDLTGEEEMTNRWGETSGRMIPDRDIDIGTLSSRTLPFPATAESEPIGADPGTYVPGTLGTPARPGLTNRQLMEIAKFKGLGMIPSDKLAELGIKSPLSWKAIPPKSRGMYSQEGTVKPFEGIEPEPVKPERPISIGGRGVYTPGEGFEEAPWPAKEERDKWINWGHGQKKNTTTGEIKKVPVRPEKSGDAEAKRQRAMTRLSGIERDKVMIKNKTVVDNPLLAMVAATNPQMAEKLMPMLGQKLDPKDIEPFIKQLDEEAAYLRKTHSIGLGAVKEKAAGPTVSQEMIDRAIAGIAGLPGTQTGPQPKTGGQPMKAKGTLRKRADGTYYVLGEDGTKHEVDYNEKTKQITFRD